MTVEKGSNRHTSSHFRSTQNTQQLEDTKEEPTPASDSKSKSVITTDSLSKTITSKFVLEITTTANEHLFFLALRSTQTAESALDSITVTDTQSK